ncbi:MAG TPA: ubiquinol-cytochrome C chaperone family protein [Stellaceae bacterium]|nr:ubiquinol-cytochrome C chaperone family protein [Stellaceae bacterium]
MFRSDFSRRTVAVNVATGHSLKLPFRRNPVQDAAEHAYRLVVEQSRRLAFFTMHGVPDTLDGRFEVICLHAFLYLRRLKGEGEAAAALSQQFFDTMFVDFDRSLREIGTGDLSVGRQVKRMAQAFYGRIRAYEDGLEGDDAVLTAALARNLYGTAAATPEQLAGMAAYLRREAGNLAAQPIAALTAGNMTFGAP